MNSFGKRIRKIASVFLCAALCIAQAVPAFAVKSGKLTGDSYFGMEAKTTVAGLDYRTIVYDYNGNGHAPDVAKVPYGRYATEPKEPKRTGYNFFHWMDGDVVFNFRTTPIEKDYTLKALWYTGEKPQTHTVTFKVGEMTFQTQEVLHNGYFNDPGTPYFGESVSFNGWYCDNKEVFPAGHSDPKHPENVPTRVTTDMIVTATMKTGPNPSPPPDPSAGNWILLNYGNGHLAFKDKSRGYDAFITANPVYEGYDGWFNQLQDKIQSNETLVISYIGSQYRQGADRESFVKVALNANGGLFKNGLDTLMVEIPKGYTLDMDDNVQPTFKLADGTEYTFDGWYYDDGTIDHEWSPSDKINEPTVLIAHWKDGDGNPIIGSSKHHVYFFTNGGTYVPTQVVEDGGVAEAPDPNTMINLLYPQRPFNNWYTEPYRKELTPYAFDTPVYKDLILIAHWDDGGIDPVDPTYILLDRANGKLERVETTEGYEKFITDHPVDDGYDGWFNENGIMIANDTTLWNSYIGHEYPPEGPDSLLDVWLYTGRYGSLNSQGLVKMKVRNGSVLDVPDPDYVQDGYTFRGWYYHGTKTRYNNEAITKNTILDAGYRDPDGNEPVIDPYPDNVHTITIDANGGTFSDGTGTRYVDVADGSALARPATPEREGYVFSSWQKDGAAYDFSAPVKADFTLKAAWVSGSDPGLHTVTLNANGGAFADGTSTKAMKVVDGQTLAKPEQPTWRYHVLYAWQKDGKTYDFSTKVTSDMELKAYWKADSNENGIPDDEEGGGGGGDPHEGRAVLIDYGNGSFGVTYVKADGRIDEPDEPTRSGYNFAGWLDDSGNGVDFSEPFDGNAIIGQWDPTSKTKNKPKYGVAFYANGGTLVNGDEIYIVALAAGDKVYGPEAVRDGCTFKGWFDKNGVMLGKNGMTVNKSMFFYARWKDDRTGNVISEMEENYVLYDDANGHYEVRDIDDGRPADPTWSGHKFNHWNDQDTGKEVDFTKELEEGSVFRADWTDDANIITVTFDSNGGSKVPSVAVIKGNAVTKPEDPVMDAGQFYGWYDKDNKAYNFSTKVSEDITLKAKWKYKVRFLTGINKGKYKDTELKAQYVLEGSKASSPSGLPEWKNHTLRGWYNANDMSYKWTFNEDTIKEPTVLVARWYKDKDDDDDDDDDNNSGSGSGSSTTSVYTPPQNLAVRETPGAEVGLSNANGTGVPGAIGNPGATGNVKTADVRDNGGMALFMMIQLMLIAGLAFVARKRLYKQTM